MPELFPTLSIFAACCLIMAGAQVIYATVGFGAGMFAVSLLAMVLPRLVDAVVVLFLLTFITEVFVLFRAWRHASGRLLVWLLPPMAAGLWLGTSLLSGGNGDALERWLGAVIVSAGLWFCWQEYRRGKVLDGNGDDATEPPPTGPTTHRTRSRWWSLSAGFASGLLGGLFGTGGPPVIMLFKAYHLEKGAFRSTIMSYFLLMSLMRWGAYLQAELITTDTLHAALWLLSASLIGMRTGMALHHRLSERAFGSVVSVLITLLGLMLLAGVGR